MKSSVWHTLVLSNWKKPLDQLLFSTMQNLLLTITKPAAYTIMLNVASLSASKRKNSVSRWERMGWSKCCHCDEMSNAEKDTL